MIVSTSNYSPSGFPIYMLPQIAASRESKEIVKAFDNDSWRQMGLQGTSLSQQSKTVSAKYISKMHIEPVPEFAYKRPQPERSYKIKVRISKRTKGRPIDYGE